jgi:hypothetical protein
MVTTRTIRLLSVEGSKFYSGTVGREILSLLVRIDVQRFAPIAICDSTNSSPAWRCPDPLDPVPINVDAFRMTGPAFARVRAGTQTGMSAVCTPLRRNA